MTTKAKKTELLNEFLPKLQPLVEEATKAFGSRATESHAHDISRMYTELLVEFDAKGGSLLQMATALGTSYPALRRRVMTSAVAPLARSKKSKATQDDYAEAVLYIKEAKTHGTTVYHHAIKNLYDRGISLNKLAKAMGLGSAYPLYYGLNKVRLNEGEK
jgi:hypothetical protein